MVRWGWDIDVRLHLGVDKEENQVKFKEKEV